MILRNYQSDCFDALGQAFVINQERNALVVMATGLGKSVIFAQMPSLFPGDQTLYMVHRKKLVKQAAEHVARNNPTLRVQVEQAEKRAAYNADVVVASMQTLARPSRRAPFMARKFALVVIDEVHHLHKGGTYDDILRDLKVFENDGPQLLGVTATPNRSGGESLSSFFDRVVFERNILWGIDQGWLSPLTAFAVYTKTNLDKVSTSKGDFKEGELAEVVNTDTRNLEIVRAYQKLASNRHTTLVFAVDKQHARDLTAAFRAADVSAEFVIDDTPDREREEIFCRFIGRNLKVLVNVGIATEGVDLPPVDCIILSRPTKSALLITQMVGRGTRLWCPHSCERYCEHGDSKRDCLIIDLVDNTSRHQLCTGATVLGLPANVNAKGKDLRKVNAKLKAFQEEFPGFDLTAPTEVTEAWLEKKRAEMKALMERSKTTVSSQEVSLFGRPDLRVQKISGLTWIRTYDGVLHLRIPSKTMSDSPLWVEVRRDASDHWHVVHTQDRQDLFEAAPEKFTTEEDALRFADGQVRRLYGDRLTLVNANAKWHRDPATDSQRKRIRQLGMTDPPMLTKGDASRMLDAAEAMRHSRKLGPPTSRMMWRLRQMGYRPEGMTYEQAGRLIGQAKGR